MVQREQEQICRGSRYAREVKKIEADGVEKD